MISPCILWEPVVNMSPLATTTARIRLVATVSLAALAIWLFSTKSDTAPTDVLEADSPPPDSEPKLLGSGQVLGATKPTSTRAGPPSVASGQYVVRSLSSRELVPYAEFEIGDGHLKRRIRASGSAILSLDNDGLRGSLHCTDKDTELRFEAPDSKPGSTGTIWLGTRLRIRVHCIFEDGTKPAEGTAAV